MPFDVNDPRLIFMLETDILKANGACEILRDRWFAVHPERGLVFWQPDTRRAGRLKGASPQCNGNESVARYVVEKQLPWAEVRKYDLVLMPYDTSDRM